LPLRPWWVSPAAANDYVVRRGPPTTVSRPNSTEVLKVLNRYDHRPPTTGEAEIRYLDGDFRIVRPGAFVRCAVTGTAIPLEELKYWSVDLQEAYIGPDAVLQRRHPERAK
jgi:hypothetical protein